MKKILKLLFWFFTISILILDICSVFKKSFLGFQLFRVGSGSMEPTIQTGDLILIKSKKDYETGDIITYKLDDEYITHRVVTIDNDKVITKGDANNIEDNEFNSENIIGKYYPFISKILTMMSQRIVLILLIIIYVISKVVVIRIREE